MTLPGETVGRQVDHNGPLPDGSEIVCNGCGSLLPLSVHSSAAGYYLGFACWNDPNECDSFGPYSRESGYFATEEEAQAALDSGQWAPR